ncbi:hypothetical protein FRC07_003976 [Ceratobasidium sp. 392]|nr:hypothetical protein FRC07_003976 [Ceratobasidium sp. 392]
MFRYLLGAFRIFQPGYPTLVKPLNVFARTVGGYPLAPSSGYQCAITHGARLKSTGAQTDKPVNLCYLAQSCTRIDIRVKPNSPKQEPSSAHKESRSRRPPRPEEIVRARAKLRKFFQQFKGFQYDPAKPYMDEFNRLVEVMRWDKKGEEYKKAKKGFYEAGVKQFNKTIGTEVDDLSAWHKLFKNIQGETLPRTVEECQIRARTLQVNIWDVLGAAAGGLKAKDFKQECLLSEYTVVNDRRFPREHVLAGKLLEFLLRHIDSPGKDVIHPKINVPSSASSSDDVIHL